MTFTLSDWMVYTIWGIFGLMITDFVVGFVRSFWVGSFDTGFLGYLKDILSYVIPLNFLLNLVSIDPTHYTFVVLYFIGGLSIMLKYVLDMIRRFRKKPA